MSNGSNNNRNQQTVTSNGATSTPATTPAEDTKKEPVRDPVKDAVSLCLRLLLRAAQYGTVARSHESEIQSAIDSLS